VLGHTAPGHGWLRPVVNDGAQSSKACEGATLPWVQISPPPPLTCDDVSSPRKRPAVTYAFVSGLATERLLRALRHLNPTFSISPSGPLSSAVLVIPVRSGRYHPDSFSPAVWQKIHHALRIDATGINPEPNGRQAIEASLDDLLKLVDRPTVGCGLHSGGELRSLGVI
jgi:hypothetical protein